MSNNIIAPDSGQHTKLTLPGLFIERVKQSPQQVAYRYFDKQAGNWQNSTWSQMSEETARWQAALKSDLLNEGDKVAIMLPNCREWVMMEQAALGLGLVVVPLYINDRCDNISYILQDAGIKVLLVHGEEQLQLLKPIQAQLDGLVRLLCLNNTNSKFPYARLKNIADWLPQQAAGLSSLTLDPNKLATIVYTSGTTGRPKGVMLSHKNILSNAYGGIDCVPIHSSDIFLSFLPLSHMLERTLGYYIPMMTGATVAFARSVNQLADDMLAIKPTVLISVPRIYERIFGKLQSQLENKSALANRLFNFAVETGWQYFQHKQKHGPWRFSFVFLPILRLLVSNKIMSRMGGRIRVAICGGAPMSPGISKTFIGLGLNLIQGYGLTETSPIISGNRENDNIPASVGTPLKGFTISVSEQGELLVKGDSVMLGYWNNLQATKDVIDSKGWLHTGDKVTIDEDQHIHITGRLKEILVLSNGEKIPPGDMEVAIVTEPLFDQALIIGEGRPFLSALVVLNPELWESLLVKLDLNNNDEDPLQAKILTDLVLERVRKCLKDFPGYAKIYRACVFIQPWTIENGLMTPTMKLKRDNILELYKDRIEQMYKGH